MAIEIRLLSPADADILEHVAPQAFDDPIDPQSTEAFLNDPRHHLAVALDDGLVVGFVSAVHYIHPDKPKPEMWINEVQVAPTHQRRGLAREMLDKILDKGHELGCSEAWVLTSVDNAPARRLYAALGGVEGPHDGVMFTFTLREDDVDTDPTIERKKERGWRRVATINRALAEGQIDEDAWHQAMADMIKPAYLAADSPYGQAGHGGDAVTWEASRGFIAEALHRSGTFLDVGCASGILMESVQRWGAAKGLSIEPYGLDIVPEFVERARRRLPRWADRIFEGNIRTWQPPAERFDYALIRPEYAPPGRRIDMVRHVLEHVLKPGGRLIVLAGTEETGSRSVEDEITRGGFTVHGRAEIAHGSDDRLVRRLFWIDGESDLGGAA
jgi:GNAT superfamily N-acetyltransferase/SAM-dependent methyltransferase